MRSYVTQNIVPNLIMNNRQQLDTVSMNYNKIARPLKVGNCLQGLSLNISIYLIMGTWPLLNHNIHGSYLIFNINTVLQYFVMALLSILLKRFYQYCIQNLHMEHKTHSVKGRITFLSSACLRCQTTYSFHLNSHFNSM